MVNTWTWHLVVVGNAGHQRWSRPSTQLPNWRRHVPLIWMTLNARSCTNARSKGSSSSRVKEPRLLICKRNSRPLAKSVTRNEHVETVREGAAQEEAERVDQELAECEDQYRQMEQRHSSGRTIYAGASRKDYERCKQRLELMRPRTVLWSFSYRFVSRLNRGGCEQHKLSRSPLPIMMAPKWQTNRIPHLMTLSKWSGEFREVQRGVIKCCLLTEQSGEVGSGGSSFREQGNLLSACHLVTRLKSV